MSAVITTDEVTDLLRAYAETRITEGHVRAAMESAAPDVDLYRDVVEQLGVAELLLPPWADGLGGDLALAGSVFTQLGRVLAWGPFLSTLGSAVPLVTELGQTPGTVAVLDRVRSGIGVAVVRGPGLTCTGDGLHPGGAALVTGTARTVRSAQEAELVLVVVEDGDTATVVGVETNAPGCTIAPVGCLDLTTRLSDVALSDASGTVLYRGDVGPLRSAADTNTLLHVACMLGSAERLLELAVEHAGSRMQFGRPIGSFQAVKHRCARMLVEHRLAAAAVDRASDRSDPQWSVRVSVAVSTASYAATVIGTNALQVFGGIGFTWEHPAHLFFKRLTTDRLSLDARRHRRRIASAIGV